MNQEPSILYIEDHPASRRVMEILLVDVMGYSQVTFMTDTQDLPAKLAALDHDIDIVFLDLNLEPLDGFAALKVLRGHPRSAGAVIMAVTASNAPEDVLKARAAGFNGLITKPIDPVKFRIHMAQILQRGSVWEVV